MFIKLGMTTATAGTPATGNSSTARNIGDDDSNTMDASNSRDTRNNIRILATA